jgi:hypothetical protein
MDYDRALASTPKAAADKAGIDVPAEATDGMESFTQSCKDGTTHALLWSNYKRHCTYKWLVLVSLGGFVVFVSDAYVGSTSDDDMLRKEWEKLLPFLPPGSLLYADRGYHMTAILAKAAAARVSLVGPPRKVTGETQSDPSMARDTARIANLRIVVEHIIGRTSMLFPWIRRKFPLSARDIVTAAVRVAFFMVNFKPPLTSGGTVSASAVKKESARLPSNEVDVTLDADIGEDGED